MTLPPFGFPAEIPAVNPAALPPDTTGLPDPASAICSAKKCREAARWAVVWNNPKIHAPDREKVWTACEDHRQTLADYLTSHRMNLIRVDPLDGGDRAEE